MNETRIRDYLSTSAATLELPGGDLDAVVRRATRRRRNRTGGAIIASVLLLVTGVVVLDAPDDQSVEFASPASLVPSPLEWTVVEPATGLAGSRSPVVGDDGAVYSLSTAPGAHISQSQEQRLRLYRSGEGAEWTEVDLPSELWAGSLATAGTRLYAVGTAPGPRGGSRLALAVTDDGGATWSTERPTLGLEELAEAHPGEITVGSPVIADGPAGIVGAVRVRTQPDIEELLDSKVDLDGRWTMVDTRGVVVIDDEHPSLEDDDDPWTTDFPGLVARFAWSELDYPEALADLVSGRVHSFAVSDDGSVESWQPMPGGSTAHDFAVLAADDGYRLLYTGWPDDTYGGDPTEPDSQMASTHALRSDDGRTWREDPAWSPTAGTGLLGSGLLAGRPSVVLGSGVTGEVMIWTATLDGWEGLNIDEVTRAATSAPEVWFGGASYGPLGVVATALADEGNGERSSYVIHSADGRTASVVAVGDHLDGGAVTGSSITVSADAVVVGLLGPDETGSSGSEGRRSNEPRKLLVGTPTS